MKPQIQSPLFSERLLCPEQSAAPGHYYVVVGDALGEDGRYEIRRIVGEGAFSKVVEAWDRREQRKCAIKIVRNTAKHRADAEMEKKFLLTIRDADPDNRYCIVKLLDLFETEFGHCCFVTELFTMTALEAVDSTGPLPLNMLAEFTLNIALALEFMHSDLNLTHTDLKPENILAKGSLLRGGNPVTQVPNGSSWETETEGETEQSPAHRPRRPRWTLCDLGSVYESNQRKLSARVCTAHYRSPEVSLGLGWSFPTDLWSLGCVLYELATGNLLFPGGNDATLENLHLMQGVLNRPFPSHWTLENFPFRQEVYFADPQSTELRKLSDFSAVIWVRQVLRETSLAQDLQDPDLQSLVLGLLELDPAKRLTAKEVAQHPFILKFIAKDTKTPSSASRQDQEEIMEAGGGEEGGQSAGGLVPVLSSTCALPCKGWYEAEDEDRVWTFSWERTDPHCCTCTLLERRPDCTDAMTGVIEPDRRTLNGRFRGTFTKNTGFRKVYPPQGLEASDNSTDIQEWEVSGFEEPFSFLLSAVGDYAVLTFSDDLERNRLLQPREQKEYLKLAMASQSSNWSDTTTIYKSFETFTAQYARHAVKILLPHVLGRVEDHRGDIKIADIACGTGAAIFSIIDELRESHASLPQDTKVTLLASDFSEGMLAKLTERWSGMTPESKPRNVTIQALPPSDMAQLNAIPSGSLDGIVCTFGLMFSLDPAKALAEFRRVLKPGAMAVIVTWTSDLSSLYIAIEARRRLIEAKIGSPEVGNVSFEKPGGPLSLATIEAMLQVITVGFEISSDDANKHVSFEQQSFTDRLALPLLIASMRLNPVAAAASPVQPPWTFPSNSDGKEGSASSESPRSDELITKIVMDIVDETEWLREAKEKICANDTVPSFPLFGHALITSIRAPPSS